MSEKYIAVSNFKFGLDTRRGELTAQPGSLVKCDNAFINVGGQVEKRLAFTVANVPFPSGTFGLQDTDEGIVTFGTLFPTQLGGPLPPGVIYQRLDLTEPAQMTKVISSTNFNGKAFVLGEVSSGNRYLWYDGKTVAQYQNGRVAPFATNLPTLSILLGGIITSQIAVESPGWYSKSNMGAAPRNGDNLNEFSAPGVTLIYSPPNIHFTPTFVTNTVNGVMGAELVDQNYPGKLGIAPVCAFSFFSTSLPGSGTVQVIAPLNRDGTNPQIISRLVSWNAAAAIPTVQLASDLVAAINAMTFETGYSAVVNASSNNSVTISAPVAWGNVTFPVTLNTTGTITATTSPAIPTEPTFELIVSSPTNFQVIVASSKAKTVSVIGQATVTFLPLGLQLLWSETNADGSDLGGAPSPSGISMSSTSASTVTFSKNMQLNTVAQGYFKCVATGGALSDTKHFVVTLELDGLT